MMDDRMEQEDQKALAENIFAQQPEHGGTGTATAVEGEVGTDHPDKAAVMEMFGATNSGPGEADVSQARHDLSTPQFDLSPLSKYESQQQPASGVIREDLVQQAAQALVKDGVDAFLAITTRMNPDEVGQTLKTARSWRRADPEWQDKFRSGPETGFKFIDQANNPGKKKRNKAEDLAHQIIGRMRAENLGREHTPAVCREVLKEHQIKMTPEKFVLFSSRVAEMLRA